MNVRKLEAEIRGVGSSIILIRAKEPDSADYLKYNEGGGERREWSIVGKLLCVRILLALRATIDFLSRIRRKEII